MLTIKFNWPNLISMYKVKTETVPAASLSKFQKPAYPYPTNFLKLNYIKPTSKLSRSNYRISVGDQALWNEFQQKKKSEKEIGNHSYQSFPLGPQL